MTDYSYHDFALPAELRGVVNHMQSVERCRNELSNLGAQWDLLTILGQMSGTGTDMTNTRRGFQDLASELLGQLGSETLNKTAQDLGAKAQVVVDIVIRNLFERTADIGFLATDNDIRDFLKESSVHDLEGRKAAIQAMRERFKEYTAKYSVYFDIVLMGTEGNVLVRMDPDIKIPRTSDGFVRESINSTAEYVETFGPSDLFPGQGDTLIYSYRVTETDAADSAPLGVLALCFRFKNEMEGIFNKLISDEDWAVLTLLDSSGVVIASSDDDHVRLGAKMDLALDGTSRVVRFAGREYIAKTCATNGYEDFFGLGWYGHALLPLDHAFDDGDANLLEKIDEAVQGAVMGDPRLFSKDLRSIPVKADQVQSELERTVWNGNVRETDAQSKVLLWNISDAGARTKSVFEKAIANLHETVVSTILEDMEFKAALVVDIMDRNLYERANDCRWWALTSAFRRILVHPEITQDDKTHISDILRYINDLYTVYTNLFIYDQDGVILAVSNPDSENMVGQTVTAGWSAATLELDNSQSYSVSPFEPSPYYDGRHTYIYGAAITALEAPHGVLGGIGIVFDSEPQFASMLGDVVGSDAGNESAIGLFVGRNQEVISSTSASYAPGDSLDLPAELFSLENGAKISLIVELGGRYYAAGACASSGYREYKVEDDYENDVIGVVLAPLADVAASAKEVVAARKVNMDLTHNRNGNGSAVEMASFYVGPTWLGVRAEKVVEAIRFESVTSIPGASKALRGKVFRNNKVIPVLAIHALSGVDYPTDESPLNIVIVKCTCELAGCDHVGIVVDGLAEIPVVDESRLSPTSALEGYGYTEGIIKPREDDAKKEMMIVLNPDALLEHLVNNANFW